MPDDSAPITRRLAKAFCAAAMAVAAVAPSPLASYTDIAALLPKGDYVVLLHGSEPSTKSMATLQRAFENEGYQVINVDYASRAPSILEMADSAHQAIHRALTDKSRKVHFVGYSIGGLVARAYVHEYPPANMGRLVMLGTPNQGSEIADLMQGTAIFDHLVGQAGNELKTAYNREALLGVPKYEAASIAGTISWDPVSSSVIEGADDGRVSVQSTTFNGMRDHLTVEETHGGLPQNHQVIMATKSFIKGGSFTAKRP